MKWGADEWREVDPANRSAWRAEFNSSLIEPDVPGTCPVCRTPDLHRYYVVDLARPGVHGTFRHQGLGRLWEWCGTCHTFESYPDGLVPEGWIAPYPTDLARLEWNPAPIEKSRTEHADRPQ